MFVGPVFTREAVVTPRRPRHFILRAVYVTALLLLMCTAWLVMAGTQIIRNLGDMAYFGAILFQILALLQLALAVFLSALGSASAVSQEKDKRTLILLLLTRLNNSELVLGKLLASLLNVMVMIFASLPVFMLITLFGGVSFDQVARVFVVTICTALVAGSLGSTLALWREKTFQTLSLTALAVMLWIGFWEAVHGGLLGSTIAGVSCEQLATGMSPFRAILLAARPVVWHGWTLNDVGVGVYVASSLTGAVLLNLVSIARVRVWNPSREVRPGQQQEGESIFGVDHADRSKASAEEGAARAETARAGHVDSIGRTRTSPGKSRTVWDNPILWREVRTWAYGRKVLIIKFAYLLLCVMATAGLVWIISSGGLERTHAATAASILPASARPLAPFFLISLVIVNALAVTSITNERDGQALDLLLVTDLSPAEFLFGKLWGVLWVTKEMVVLPMLLCGYLWWRGGVDTENLCYVLGGLAVMYTFVSILGIHCGMTYANSRVAIGVSLGTVFFLFLGVATCIMMMISFTGSFQTQLLPFLSLILGGGVGLYVALGARNPSPAILTASIVLPFATFFAITSFMLPNHELTVFLVSALAYGFTTAAMMIPALGEFDIAMGRARTAEDE